MSMSTIQDDMSDQPGAAAAGPDMAADRLGAGSAKPGNRPGYMSPEIVGCQFSVYPLLQKDIDGPVQAAIGAAGGEGCSVRVGNLSTLLSGSEDQVFAALRAAFRAAQRQGPAVMTATLAAGMPTDKLVGEIQRDLSAGGTAAAGATARPLGTEL
jgi:uncharacterized protein YqgV (UPF0045/DUF77 family)